LKAKQTFSAFASKHAVMLEKGKRRKERKQQNSKITGRDV
jgi:hypothetical protein